MSTVMWQPPQSCGATVARAASCLPRAFRLPAVKSIAGQLAPPSCMWQQHQRTVCVQQLSVLQAYRAAAELGATCGVSHHHINSGAEPAASVLNSCVLMQKHGACVCVGDLAGDLPGCLDCAQACDVMCRLR
jgi:hypothetical protein